LRAIKNETLQQKRWFSFFNILNIDSSNCKTVDIKNTITWNGSKNFSTFCVSETTVITYAQAQKIGTPNNLKKFASFRK
jgi:hypothetical protein